MMCKTNSYCIVRKAFCFVRKAFCDSVVLVRYWLAHVDDVTHHTISSIEVLIAERV